MIRIIEFLYLSSFSLFKRKIILKEKKKKKRKKKRKVKKNQFQLNKLYLKNFGRFDC